VSEREGVNDGVSPHVVGQKLSSLACTSWVRNPDDDGLGTNWEMHLQLPSDQSAPITKKIRGLVSGALVRVDLGGYFNVAPIPAAVAVSGHSPPAPGEAPLQTSC
jgi:hypothetical protein